MDRGLDPAEVVGAAGGNADAVGATRIRRSLAGKAGAAAVREAGVGTMTASALNADTRSGMFAGGPVAKGSVQSVVVR